MPQPSIPPREEWTPAMPNQWQLWVSLGRILRAVTAAMQPARVIIGLLMLVAIGTFGVGWDGAFQPGISATGLAGGWADETARIRAQAGLRMVAELYVSPEQWPVETDEAGQQTWQHIDAGWLLGSMRAGYLAKRAEVEDEAQRAADEANYFMSVQRVHATRLKGSWESLSHAITAGFHRFVQGVISINAAQAMSGLSEVCIHTPPAIWQADRMFTICFALVLVIVLALGGGAISRIAVTHFARQPTPSLRESFTVSLVYWRPLIGCQLLPLVFVGILSGILMLVGLVMRVPGLDIIGGAASGIWLLFGLAIALLMICYVAGFCMLIPAVVTERNDAADAMQRTYAFVINGPLQLAVSFIIALIGLAVGYVVIAAIASLTVNTTMSMLEFGADASLIQSDGSFGIFALGTGASPERVLAGFTNTATGWFVSMWLYIVGAIVGGYVLSYVFSASSIIYLLMRRIVDGQAIDDLWAASDGQAIRATEQLGDAGDEAFDEDR